MTAWNGKNRRIAEEKAIKEERRVHRMEKEKLSLKGLALRNISLTVSVCIGGIILMLYLSQLFMVFDTVKENEIRSIAAEAKAETNEKIIIGMEKDINYIKQDISEIKESNKKILEKLNK